MTGMDWAQPEERPGTPPGTHTALAAAVLVKSGLCCLLLPLSLSVHTGQSHVHIFDKKNAFVTSNAQTD